MAGQASSGLYRLLFHPRVYELIQTLLGAERARRWLVQDVLRLRPGCRILDLGCGTGALVPMLGDVEYLGLDNNPAYIEQARRTHGRPGVSFLCAGVEDLERHALGTFERVSVIGVLHHLPDALCRQLFEAAARHLAPDGVVATLDPCFYPGQSWPGRFVTSLDRGKDVRTPAAYRALADATLPCWKGSIRYRYNALPYTGCVLHGAHHPDALGDFGWADPLNRLFSQAG